LKSTVEGRNSLTQTETGGGGGETKLHRADTNLLKGEQRASDYKGDQKKIQLKTGSLEKEERWWEKKYGGKPVVGGEIVVVGSRGIVFAALLEGAEGGGCEKKRWFWENP